MSNVFSNVRRKKKPRKPKPDVQIVGGKQVVFDRVATYADRKVTHSKGRPGRRHKEVVPNAMKALTHAATKYGFWDKWEQYGKR